MSGLPPSPDLSFEKKQAKALLRDFRAGAPEAQARVRAHVARTDLTLADAQFVIARERGFESWPKLKAHIEAQSPLSEQADRFLRAIIHTQPAVARRILDEHPGVASFSIFTAAGAGNVAAVAEFLEDDPASATATISEIEATPLVFACGSPLHHISHQHAAQLQRIAELLMEAGASPNSFSLYPEGETKAPISVLYHAIMADHTHLVRMLLQRGARTQDGESIYHAAQHHRVECLELLREFGADFSSSQSPYGNTPLYFLVGHRVDQDGHAPWFKGMVWLLDHGAGPNVTSYKKKETPLHGIATSAPKMATARALLSHGADVNQPRGDGKTPYAIAMRHGNFEMADLFRQHGARTDVLAPIEEFLGACLAADELRARALLSANPGLLGSMTDEDRGALGDAVNHERADAVRLMIELGFDAKAELGDGGTALHWASWEGRLAMVKLLLSMGAPVNVKDKMFGGSPLGWALHGSQNSPRRGNDDAYIAIVDLLLAQGATREAATNKFGEAPESFATKRVLKHFVERGFVPAT
ncbi:MAG TPA: ankyrin repeat domain-containing protein [Gemmatimonadales bacterium]|nr:ankyrin repeat domain-containing protein [Gemmatimonadales bacterium]